MKIKIYTLLPLVLLLACSDFLEESSQTKVRPSTVSDLEQIFLGEAYGAEDYCIYNCTRYFTDDDQSNGVNSSGQQEEHNKRKWLFTWADNMFTESGSGYDAAFYQAFYERILGCNLVLDNLDDMEGSHQERESLRGEALTLRAWYYLQLVNLYGIAYNQGTPSTDPGVPLKLTSTVSTDYMSPSTVKDVYARIEQDLLEGNRLLTTYDFNRNYFRLGHLAAKAILSRVYLYMEEWDKAFAYADSVLTRKSDLLDLNSVTWNDLTRNTEGVYSSSTPDEILWGRTALANYSFDLFNYLKVPFSPSIELTGSFERGTVDDFEKGQIGDIRAVVYFSWMIDFSDGMPYQYGMRKSPGNKTSNQNMQGIRTAELYLNQAEVYARKYLTGANSSHRTALLDILNKLRRHRMNAAFPYEEVDIADGEELLEFYLEERRRELCGETNHRWCDLRRFGITVTHVLKENNTSTEYTKDMSRYALPFQAEIITWNPGLVQNK